MVPTYFNIVFEDLASEGVIERLLSLSQVPVSVRRRIPARGCGYIRSRIERLNAAATLEPYFVLMDSDSEDCALHLLDSLLPPQKRSEMCLFRLAVHEVESWLLADHKGIGRFLGVSAAAIHRDPDSILDPKGYLIQLARKSRNKEIRSAIVPDSRTTAKVGREYNQRMLAFIAGEWNVEAAADRSESLRRAINAVKSFTP